MLSLRNLEFVFCVIATVFLRYPLMFD